MTNLFKRHSLFKVVLRHLCLEATLQILPVSGAEGGILLNGLSTHTSLTSSVGWFVVVLKTYYLSEISSLKTRQNHCNTSIENERRLECGMRSCRPVRLTSLNLLTRPCFYILETSAFSKYDHIRVSGILS